MRNHRFYACNANDHSYREIKWTGEIKPDEIFVAIPITQLKGLDSEEVGGIVSWYSNSISQGIGRMQRVRSLDKKVTE